MIRILLVEDDKDLNFAVCKHLDTHYYQTVGCFSAREALELLYGRSFDLIISDIMMPGMDGFTFAKNIREHNKNIPILFISARDDFTAKERGYHLGIDDYMVKPINLDELVLHIEALIRRAKIIAESSLTIGELTMNEEEMTVTLAGEPIELTLREFQILFRLLSYPKRIFTRSQLLDDFSGIENESGLRTVDVFIANLRTKFADCSSFKIVTVRGVGYKAVLL